MKSLNQQTMQRTSNATTNALNQVAATGNIQLLGTIQRPRAVPIAASPISSKQQINARGLITTQTSQRNITGPTLKIGTPITGTILKVFFLFN